MSLTVSSNCDLKRPIWLSRFHVERFNNDSGISLALWCSTTEMCSFERRSVVELVSNNILFYFPLRKPKPYTMFGHGHGCVHPFVDEDKERFLLLSSLLFPNKNVHLTAQIWDLITAVLVWKQKVTPFSRLLFLFIALCFNTFPATTEFDWAMRVQTWV